MSSRYLEAIRSNRSQKRGFQFNAKTLLMILAVCSMIGSTAYWWGIQSVLTPNKLIAGAFTSIMVLAPPCLISFLIPWSPAGMLLAKINARTWGGVAVVAMSMVLVYYSWHMQQQWWLAQDVVRNSGIVTEQVLVGLIGFVFIPALLWTPVSSEELTEQIRQAHLVRRYELQTQADIAILRNTLLRAQEKALIGFANLTVEEKTELSSVMRGLVKGIDSTMKELASSVKAISGAATPFTSLDDNEEIKNYLDYVADSLEDSTVAPSTTKISVQNQQQKSQGNQLSTQNKRPYNSD